MYTIKHIMFITLQQDECSKWFRRPCDKLAFLRIKMMLPLAEITGLKSPRFQSYFSFYYFNEINFKTLSLIQARSPGHNELNLFLFYYSKFLEFFPNLLFSHSYQVYTNELMSRETQFDFDYVGRYELLFYGTQIMLYVTAYLFNSSEFVCFIR